MKVRVLSLLVFGFALALFASAAASAQDKKDAPKAKDTHEGTFVSATGNEFTMKHKDKEHSHTLAADGKVIGADGKESKLSDIKAGAMIRVTTKAGDMKTAVKVEVLKKKGKDKDKG